MAISLDMVKALREKTGAGIVDCKDALSQTGGDIDKAAEILRRKGISIAEKKAGRATKEGIIGSYVHLGNKIGVLVEVNCETDFVARNETFQAFVKDIAMQVAASSPVYLSAKDVPSDVLEKEKELILSGIKDKPKDAQEKIIEGKLQKFYQDFCLLEQPFIKDPAIKIQDYLTQIIAKTGENIAIRRFVRFALGE